MRTKNDMLELLEEFDDFINSRCYPYGEPWEFTLEYFYEWLKNYHQKKPTVTEKIGGAVNKFFEMNNIQIVTPMEAKK
jgi:hypothetical protein